MAEFGGCLLLREIICDGEMQDQVIVPGLIEYREGEGKTLIVAMGRVISASALGGLQEEHGQASGLFGEHQLRFWYCKADQWQHH